MTVSIRLMGGLGNQLFQIFTTIAHAVRHNQNFTFPHELVEAAKKRPTYWNSFLKNLKPYLRKRVIGPCYCEHGFHFETIPIFKKNTILSGYFQSHKYFEQECSQINSILGIKEQQEQIALLYSDLLTGSPVSMHFRFGDYKNNDYFTLLTLDYYRNSLQYLNPSKVLYFCEEEDDNAVESIILDLPNLNFVKVPNSIPDWQQLLLMSCCQNNIIANSTFSWWGAYLNSTTAKIVCYPDVWFGPKLDYTTSDLIPENWIRQTV